VSITSQIGTECHEIACRTQIETQIAENRLFHDTQLRCHRDFPGDDASDIPGVVDGIKPGISRENADYNEVDLHSDLAFV
jgi:hypothetical protein